MTDNYLRALLHGFTPEEVARWYQQQIIISRYLRSDLLRRSGIKADSKTEPMEIPEAEEVVDETILRIRDGYSDRYKWDGGMPSTFNRFFARCLKTTLNSLRSTERKHSAAPSRLENQLKVLQPTAYELSVKPDDSLAQEQSGPVLATVIATTRIAGKMKIYADRLPRYAAHKNTATEIAEDIGVKSATIDTFRKRLRKILKESES